MARRACFWLVMAVVCSYGCAAPVSERRVRDLVVQEGRVGDTIHCPEPPPDVVVAGTEVQIDIKKIINANISIENKLERIRDTFPEIQSFEALNFQFCMMRADGAISNDQWSEWVDYLVKSPAREPEAEGDVQVSMDEIREDIRAEIQSGFAQLRNDPDFPRPEVGNALAAYADGNFAPAEELFWNRMKELERGGQQGMKEPGEAHEEALFDLRLAAINARRVGVLKYLNDTDGAIDAFRKAAELEPGVPQDWLYLGQLYRRNGDLVAAGDALDKSIDLAKATENGAIFAEATGQKGTVLVEQEKWKLAEDTLYRAMGLANGEREKRLVADQYGNLGVMYRRMGDLDRAIAGFWNSRSINQKLARSTSLARDYLHLGNVYSDRGYPRTAVHMYESSMKLFKQAKHPIGFATAQSNWAMNSVMVGDMGTVRAEGVVRDSLKIQEDAQNKEGIARDNGNLGKLYLSRRDLVPAKEYLEKALALYKDLPSQFNEAMIYFDLGNLYLEVATDSAENGLQDNRTAALREAEKAYWEADDRIFGTAHYAEFAKVRMRLGEVIVEQGDLKRAIEVVQFAVGMLDFVGPRSVWEPLYFFLAGLQHEEEKQQSPTTPGQ